MASTQVDALKLQIEATKVVMENVKALLTVLNDKITNVANVDAAIIETATTELSNSTAALQTAMAAIVV